MSATTKDPPLAAQPVLQDSPERPLPPVIRRLEEAPTAADGTKQIPICVIVVGMAGT